MSTHHAARTCPAEASQRRRITYHAAICTLLLLLSFYSVLPIRAATKTWDGSSNGNNGITKSQPGTLIFSGNSVNSYSGPTVVNGGILQLGKSSLLAIAAGSLTIGDGLGGADADIVREVAPGLQIGDNVPITINS